MLALPFYHGITRRTIVGFGQLFSNIKIERVNSTGTVEQVIDVPISYGNREKWYQRLQEEGDLSQRVLISLPRIGFEIVGISYDASRKLNKLTQYRACSPTQAGNFFSAYSPVPYNLEFNLYIMTKTQDDMFQIVEQILPYFGPQYTLAINAVPQLAIVQNVPITLSNISINDAFEGPMADRREIVSTLTFVAKVEYLGPINDDADTIILHTKVKLDPMANDTAREVDVDVSGTVDNYTIIENFFDIPRPIT